MLVLWFLVSVHLDIVLVSVQVRCPIFAKHTIGLEIILDAPDGTTEVTLTQGWCTVCAERSIGSKIILDTPDGTPR